MSTSLTMLLISRCELIKRRGSKSDDEILNDEYAIYFEDLSEVISGLLTVMPVQKQVLLCIITKVREYF